MPMIDSWQATEKCMVCGRLMEYHDSQCDPDDIRRHKANLKRRMRAKAQRRAMKDAADSVGVRKVRGALGGTYYE
jgi:hypothetical protein